MRALKILAAVLLIAVLTAPHRARAQGLDFVLVCDESGSMEYPSRGANGEPLAPSDPARLRVDSAKLFVELCGPDDRVAVIGFGSRVTTHAPLTVTDDDGKENLTAAIERIQGNQAHTDMYGALRRALSVLGDQSQEGRRAFIVFLTDGRIDGPGDLPKTYTDNYSLDEYRSMLERTAGEAGAKDWSLLTIALGPDADRGLLARLASLGKGHAYEAQDASQLEPIYADIFCNLTGRFFRHAAGSQPPLDVEVEPGLRELVTLGFPPKPVARHGRARARYDAGFLFTPPGEGSNKGSPTRSATRSWDVARLKDPAPGRWRVDFQKDRVADLLLVKTPKCRFSVTRPDEPSYPPGTVELEVTQTGDDGKPAPGCLAKARATVTGPGLANPADVELAESSPGRLSGRTPELTTAGDYRVMFHCYLSGGKDFASEQQRTFKIDTSLQPAKKTIQIKIARPEAPPPPASYPDQSTVPIEAQVVSPPPEGGLKQGDAITDLTVSGKDGTVPVDPVVEGPAGVFTSKTAKLSPGDYTVVAHARLANDPSATAQDSRTFTIVAPPPTPITLAIKEPSGRPRSVGALPVEVDVRGPGGALGPGEASGQVTVNGPDGPRSVDLAPGPSGGLVADGIAVTKPGRYHVEVRVHRTNDPRSTAFGAVDVEVRPPRLVIDGPQIGGTLPLFAGESFNVTCVVRTEGASGAAQVSAELTPPAGGGGGGGGVDDAPPTAIPLTRAGVGDGGGTVGPGGGTQGSPGIGAGVQLTGSGTTRADRPGAYQLTIKATSKTSIGTLTATTAALVPALLYSATALEPPSMQSDQPTTTALGVGSLMDAPVTVAVSHGTATAQDGGKGPTISGPSMTMTRVETTTEYWPVEVDLTPATDPVLGPHAVTLDLALSGRYKGGRTWQRHKTVGPLALEVTRPPVSGVVWLLLALALIALVLAKPSFAFCALVAPDGNRFGLFGLGSLLSDWGQAIQGVGGLDQPVAVVNESVEPVLLVGHWFGHYGVLTASGEQPLARGQEVKVGTQAYRFIRFKDPGPPPAPPASGDGPGPGDEHPQDIDLTKIA